MAKFKEGYIPFRAYKTYYCIVGECEDGKLPLLCLHGGPGCGSFSIRQLDDQADYGRSVIYYDQIGSDKSAVSSDPGLWNAEFWVDELMNVIKELQAMEDVKLGNFHLLGQSWGGMLALQAVIEKKPAGLKSLTLASTMASTSLWCREGMRLASYLPPEMRDAIYEAAKTGKCEGELYEKAVDEFYKRHLCTKAMPPDLAEFMSTPNESYLCAWGPSEFNCSGTLNGWEYTDRLGEIEVPTLITSGIADECTPLVAKSMNDGIKNSRWELFADCGHMVHFEEREKYNKVLAEFLGEND